MPRNSGRRKAERFALSPPCGAARVFLAAVHARIFLTDTNAAPLPAFFSQIRVVGRKLMALGAVSGLSLFFRASRNSCLNAVVVPVSVFSGKNDLLVGHPGLGSIDDRIGLLPGLLGKVRRFVADAINHDKPSVGHVASLGHWGRPSAIAGGVPEVHVNTVNRMFRRRTLTHVDGKSLKGILPLGTHRNSSPAIPLPQRAIRVMASLFEVHPCSVEVRLRRALSRHVRFQVPVGTGNPVTTTQWNQGVSG
jgi:hypothetical protein